MSADGATEGGERLRQIVRAVAAAAQTWPVPAANRTAHGGTRDLAICVVQGHLFQGQPGQAGSARCAGKHGRSATMPTRHASQFDGSPPAPTGYGFKSNQSFVTPSPTSQFFFTRRRVD